MRRRATSSLRVPRPAANDAGAPPARERRRTIPLEPARATCLAAPGVVTGAAAAARRLLGDRRLRASQARPREGRYARLGRPRRGACGRRPALALPADRRRAHLARSRLTTDPA